jgi:hypothetical protein
MGSATHACHPQWSIRRTRHAFRRECKETRQPPNEQHSVLGAERKEVSVSSITQVTMCSLRSFVFHVVWSKISATAHLQVVRSNQSKALPTDVTKVIHSNSKYICLCSCPFERKLHAHPKRITISPCVQQITGVIFRWMGDHPLQPSCVVRGDRVVAVRSLMMVTYHHEP